MKSGYIYVLVHPSDSDLYKIGVTTRTPEQRLAQHNSDYNHLTGRIVKETCRKWELKEFHHVPDIYWAESVFWGETPFADIPYRRGIEVEKMEWEWVQKGLGAAKKAGLRPGPGPHPDYVYANTSWMRKRLEGRGIILLDYVTSKSGKATFRCQEGHEWRARSGDVGKGEGCPECGIGERAVEEIWQVAKLGYICLLVHPDKSGIVKIGVTYRTLEQCYEEGVWGQWQVHRYRFVEEPILAETLVWRLLGRPPPNAGEPIAIDLGVAEQAFRDLIYEMHREISLMERAKERNQGV